LAVAGATIDDHRLTKKEDAVHGMMDGMSGMGMMMGGMALLGLIALVVLALVAAAAVKYLFFDKRKEHRNLDQR